MGYTIGRRPRWKDYLQCAYCLTVDWLSAFAVLYRSDKRGPLIGLGAAAQHAWWRSHNNRFYRWLDGEEAEMDRAMVEGKPVSVVGPTCATTYTWTSSLPQITMNLRWPEDA